MDMNDSGRRKRTAEEALGGGKAADLLPRDMFGLTDSLRGPASGSGSGWDHAHNARLLAQSLSGAVPSAEASTSFYPGYQWWPSQLITTESLGSIGISAPMDIPPVSAPMSYNTLSGYAPTQQHASTSSAQDSFPYGTEMSQQYAPGMNYPFEFSRYSQHDHRRPNGQS